jgi:hypothetical protein
MPNAARELAPAAAPSQASRGGCSDTCSRSDAWLDKVRISLDIGSPPFVLLMMLED